VTDPLRVGLLGVGWGSVVQVPAFRAVDGYEVAALCSRRAESVAAAGEKLGIADVSTDWEAFVQRDDLDLISVCTPVDLHHAQVLAAIDAGKHVLVEKPVAVDATETAEMLAAATAAGVVHAVCFESRLDPIRSSIAAAVRAGAVGRPYLAQFRSQADYWHPTRGLQSEWMYKLAEGGGYLMGMASHDIDFACALFGAPVSVCADIRTMADERVRDDGSVLTVDADDTSMLLLRMPDGLLVTISTTAAAFGQDLRDMQIFGDGGALNVDGTVMGGPSTAMRLRTTIDPDGSALAPLTRRLASGVELPARRATGAIEALAFLLEDLLPAFGGAPVPGVPSLVDGHVVQAVIDAARASSAGGGWVAPPGMSPP
jgi:predicted dehydrogenase